MTTTLFSLRRFRLLLAFLLLTIPALAKEVPLQVIDWPDAASPILRFTFAKFKPLPGMGIQRGYEMEVLAQNLSSKHISAASFSVYLFDKNKVRVGEDVISVTNLGSGESVKFHSTVAASGVPAFISIQSMEQGPKTVSFTVNTTPQGAVLKVDDAEVGTTPRVIHLRVGRHILNFSKEGFNASNFPLEVSPDDVSGGTVSYELGTATFDSIELRDGSVLNGDLVSMTGMDVEVRIGGSIQHLDRNKIKRIVLTQRDNPTPESPNASK